MGEGLQPCWDVLVLSGQDFYGGRSIRIAIFHGWELTGSGSNEYSRYLARSLARAGHEVHIPCREENPDRIEFATAAFRWDREGIGTPIFTRRSVDLYGSCTIHVLPHTDVRPVFVTDQQRAGNVKAFTDMTDAEVASYRQTSIRALRGVLSAHPVEVLHANHVILQPTIAADACDGTPFIIFPHGSAIEYTLRPDVRYQRLAGNAIGSARGLIIGSNEVRNRLLSLYPERRAEILAKSEIIGVGVDTALFEPVHRRDRTTAIGNLKRLRPGGGKTRVQEEELRHKLDAGDLDAVLAYRDAYPHARPDSAVEDKLESISWQDDKILLFVGALTVGKGLQSVIVGLPRVLQHAPDTHLVIVGSGAYREVLEALVHAIATGNAELLQRLTAQGNDLDNTHLSGPWTDVAGYLAEDGNLAVTLGAGRGFAMRVHFLGRLNHDLLRFVFPCADVALFPSLIPEAYPLVLMESLSNGVLPVASNFSGFAEGLDNLVSHLGAKRVDLMRLPMETATRVRGIAERLSALVADRQDWSHELRMIAASRYDWTSRAREMVEAYTRYIS